MKGQGRESRLFWPRRSLPLALVCLLATCGDGIGGRYGGAHDGNVLRVDVDAPGTGRDGKTWTTAFLHPRDALDRARSGDEIWVAEGTYARRGSGDTVLLTMKDGVSIYGGFSGTESQRTERDWAAHPTTLDGEGLVYHVVVGASDGVLDGFTMTGGNADGSASPDNQGGGMYNSAVTNLTIARCTFSGNTAAGVWACGGGMYNRDSSPTVTNCTFSWNAGGYEGGGMYNERSFPAVTECTFLGNSSYYGGGMHNSSSSPTITDCSFEGNTAGYGGGIRNRDSSPTVADCTFSRNWGGFGCGMSNQDSSPTVTRCTFTGNLASVDAGGMHNGSSSPAVTDCIFSGNWAAYRGGGMRNWWNSSPVVANCVFSGNSADRDGGGMSNSYSSFPTVMNCTFSRNSASADGGGMENSVSSPTVTNCTFSGNSAGDRGGGMRNRESSYPVVRNCILWGDSASTGPEVYDDTDSTCTVTYSDVQGGYAGTGNIDSDPFFVGASGGNLRLRTGSPCIDSGDGDGAPATDIEGNARHDDPDTTDTGTGAITCADMGAYEYRGPAVTVALPEEATEGDGVLIGAGTASVPSNVASDLAVTLSSEDTTEVSVPPSVTISAGTSSADFDVTISDDAVRDGDKVVTVAGSAAGYLPGAETITVRDDEMTVWYVDFGATGAGTSWADAFPHPQDAMDVAIAGDEVWVAEGIFAFRSRSDAVLLTMKDGVSLYGGFVGTEVLRDERDWSAHVTTLNGWNLVLHVVVVASDATVDGFTVTGGDAAKSRATGSGGGMYNNNVTGLSVANCIFSDNSADDDGGGMYNFNSSLAVTDCTFSGTSSFSYGGGMYNRYSSPTVTRCSFWGNTGRLGGGMSNSESSPTVTDCIFSGNMSDWGGGMFNSSSSPTVVACTFSGNTGTNYGGGMMNGGSSPTVMDCTFSWNWSDYGGGMSNDSSSSPALTNCTFSTNSATYDGGGMHNYYGSSPSVTSCAFSGNMAGLRGGGIINKQSSPAVTNCTFAGNTAGDNGGGVCSIEFSSPTVTNCTFSGNAGNCGGGMHNFYYSSPTVTNCTFSGNAAVTDGGGMCISDNCSPTITNCILWGDSAPSEPEIYRDGTSFPTISYSDIGGGYSGTGNIDSDPLFVNAPFRTDLTAADGTTTTVEITDASTNYAVNDVIEIADDGIARTVSSVSGTTVTFGPALASASTAGTLVQNWGPGAVNLVADLHLSGGSPCIDAADGPSAPATDIEGNARVDDPAAGNTGLGPPWADMGAHEHTP